MPEFKPGARLSKKPPLNEQELYQIDAYWRAANYLTACQLYLLDNPLLERPLRKSDLKQTSSWPSPTTPTTLTPPAPPTPRAPCTT